MIPFLIICCCLYALSIIYKLIYVISGFKESEANSLMAYCILSFPLSILIEVALISATVWLG